MRAAVRVSSQTWHLPAPFMFSQVDGTFPAMQGGRASKVHLGSGVFKESNTLLGHSINEKTVFTILELVSHMPSPYTITTLNLHSANQEALLFPFYKPKEGGLVAYNKELACNKKVYTQK